MSSIRDSYFNEMLEVAANHRDDYVGAGIMLSEIMDRAQNDDEFNLGFVIGDYMYAPPNPVD